MALTTTCWARDRMPQYLALTGLLLSGSSDAGPVVVPILNSGGRS